MGVNISLPTHLYYTYACYSATGWYLVYTSVRESKKNYSYLYRRLNFKLFSIV